MTETYASGRAEIDLMGALLLSPGEVLESIRPIVSEADFYNSEARAVYKAVKSCIDGGKGAEVSIILAEAAQMGEVVTALTAEQAMRQAPLKSNCAALAEIVRNAAVQREAQAVGLALADGRTTVLEALAKLQEHATRQGSKLQHYTETVVEFADYLDSPGSPFIETGFVSLDKALSGGFVQSGFIALAARPGTGKTTVAINLAERIAATGKAVLYFSVEMDKTQILARRTAALSGLPFADLYEKKIERSNKTKLEKLAEAQKATHNHPFYIYDKPCSLDDIEQIIRTTPDVALVVIDHIGLISHKSGGSRYEIMTAISHRLKQIALSTGIPILGLCQLNRQSETRENKRPTMADLRDTGAIEEDADAVILLFRPERYADEDAQPKPWDEQEIALIIDKNRHGATGTVKLGFIPMSAKIQEIKAKH